MITRIDAITSLVPNAEVTCWDNGQTIWHNPSTAPVTDAQIDAELTRLQAEYDAKQYQRDRVAEYPSIQEQLDLLYWDKVNGTDNWEQAIAAVKAEYPKG
jgi:hypothetical protein